MHAILDGVRGECKTLLSRIPTSLANMTVAEFADTYAFSYDLATRGQAHSKRMQIDETRALASPSKLERGVASAMKRCVAIVRPHRKLSPSKGNAATPYRRRHSRKPSPDRRCPLDLPSDLPMSHLSPPPRRQKLRLARCAFRSLSASLADTRVQLKRSTRSRAASPTSAAAQPSMHQGFVYRARPSLLEQGAVDTAMPVPPTPSGRRPRKHESIQVRAH
jgi:hypothetical protein